MIDTFSQGSEAMATAIATLVVLILGFSTTSVYFFFPILMLFILQFLFVILTQNCVGVQKPLLESLDKTAVEAVNSVFVVKILGIADLIKTIYTKKLKTIFKLVVWKYTMFISMNS